MINRADVIKDTIKLTESLDNVKDYNFIDNNYEYKISSSNRNKIIFHQLTTTSAIQLYNNPVALNFASAKRPGGGCLKGTNAQEEDICYKSSLYNSLVGCKEYYDNPKSMDDYYTDKMIYSPSVWVIRDEYFNIIEPHKCAIITCAAPNNHSEGLDKVKLNHIFNKRINNVLSLAEGKHDTIILGAWGCGVFKNDPTMVATSFKENLCNFSFKQVVFAIPDYKNFNIFKDILDKGLNI